MKNTIKKRLLLVLVAMILLSTVPIASVVGLELPHIGFGVTAKATTQGDFEYSVWNNKAEITDYTGSATQLSIPSELGGYPVTSIGDYAFYYCDSLTSITIPDSVTSIGDSAFQSCDSLASITIPDSVTSIGDDAFYSCNSLTSTTVDVNNAFYSSDEYGVLFTRDKTTLIQYPIGNTRTSYTIPASVTSIGYTAFQSCDSLTSITIPDSVTSIGYTAFQSCDSLASITIPDSVTSIGDSAFRYCDSLTSVTIPDSVTSIGDSAFCYCESLTSITIPDSVTSIGEEAFSYCESLTSITFPDSVTSIGDYAFYYCKSLTSITIPDRVTSIGDYAFRDCDSLTSITVDVNNAFYGNDEYGALFTKDKTMLIQYPIGNTRTSYTIPDSVTSIGDYAFFSCDSLTSITIPGSVTSIGASAFYGCSYLASITIPDSVTSIAYSAFYGCNSLTSITIPDSVTSIGKEAFNRCTALTAITIPDSVTTIGDYAFKNCSNLTAVVIGNNVLTIGHEAFSDCSKLKSVSMGDSVTEIGEEAFYNCILLSEIDFSNSITVIGDNAIINTAWYVNHPDGIVYVGKVVYGYKGELPKVVAIKEGTTRIASRAFLDCISIEEITLPPSINYIGEFAFWGCKSIKKVYIDDLASWLNVEIPYGYSLMKTVKGISPLYYGADLYINDKLAEEIVIPEGMKKINTSVFEGCGSIKKVVLLDGVERIGSYAFADCKNLKEINIPSGIEYVYQFAFSGTSDVNVYISDMLSWLNISFALGPIDNFPCGSNPLSGDGKLYLNNKLVEEVLIPPDTKVINTCVFEGCSSIKVIYVPKSLESIEPYIISRCENIEKIYYEGTKEDWEKINIGDGNEDIEDVEIVFNSKMPSVFYESDFAIIDNNANVIVSGVSFAQLMERAGNGSSIKDGNGNELPTDKLPATGMLLVLPDGKEHEIVVLGDVDCDGAVSTSDARLALRASVGLEDYTPESAHYKAANVGREDNLSVSDARLILRAAVGLEDVKNWMK